MKGYIRIRVTGYSAERFLNACSHRGILLWGLQSVSGAYEMNITIQGFRQLKSIIRKTGTKVVVVKRFGLPFLLHKYRKRKLFFAGFFLCVFLVIFLSQYIWNIHITGNVSHTDEALLEYLKEQQVENGMAKADVDCDRIVKDLRRQFDDILWVSASVTGTRLEVQIKENEDSVPVKESVGRQEDVPEKNPVDIIADRDCVITEMVVRKGIRKVQPGAQVKKGNVLVSGQVPVLNDAKEVVNYQYHEADADITGKTQITYEDSVPLNYIEKNEAGIEKTAYTLLIGRYRLTFGEVRKTRKNFEEYASWHQVKIFENFYLPIYYGIRTMTPYRPSEKPYSKKQVQRLLSGSFSRYCKDLEEKGVEILQNDVKIYTESDTAVARGTLTVLMPVGKKKPSEPIEIPPEQNMEQTGEAADGNDGSSH